MKHTRKQKNVLDLIGNYRSKQENISWPGPWVNGPRIDRFLWNGSANPTRLQQCAAWMMGACLFLAGLVWLSIAIKFRASFFAVLYSVAFACCSVFAGIRIFLNGFPKKARRGRP